MISITRLVTTSAAVFALATVCLAQEHAKSTDLGKGTEFKGKTIEMKDKSKVASILGTDGYTMQNGKWTKNGSTIKFTLEDPSSYSDYFEDCNLIEQQLNALAREMNGQAPGTLKEVLALDRTARARAQEACEAAAA